MIVTEVHNHFFSIRMSIFDNLFRIVVKKLFFIGVKGPKDSLFGNVEIAEDDVIEGENDN